MHNNRYPRSLERFERNASHYGAGSPEEQLRVLRQMSWDVLSTARRRLVTSMTLLDRPEAQRVEPVVLVTSPPARRPTGELSRRQLEIAGLIREGLTNAEIAERLVLTVGTVANHVAAILTRLNFRNRAQIAVWAAGHGLGTDPGDNQHS